VTDGKIQPPWTPEQVDALNSWQSLQRSREFTCALHSERRLHARTDGWFCSTGCAYRMLWAWAWMAEPE